MSQWGWHDNAHLVCKHKSKLTFYNFFWKNTADIQWANSSLVGDPKYPNYKGNEVVLTNSTLYAFAAYMNSKKFPFTYDQATALFSKDMWNPDTTLTPDTRAAVVGFAYVAAICSSYRYSIIEEYGGFPEVTVVAHELGHKYICCIFAWYELIKIN